MLIMTDSSSSFFLRWKIKMLNFFFCTERKPINALDQSNAIIQFPFRIKKGITIISTTFDMALQDLSREKKPHHIRKWANFPICFTEIENNLRLIGFKVFGWFEKFKPLKRKNDSVSLRIFHNSPFNHSHCIPFSLFFLEWVKTFPESDILPHNSRLSG